MGDVIDLRLLPKKNGVGLTIRQRVCLQFVREHIHDHGSFPPRKLIGEFLGVVSPASVDRILAPLIERGLLTEPKP